MIFVIFFLILKYHYGWPMTVKSNERDGKNRYFLAGIETFAFRACWERHDGTKKYLNPSTYTSISAAREWIEATLAKHGGKVYERIIFLIALSVL